MTQKKLFLSHAAQSDVFVGKDEWLYLFIKHPKSVYLDIQLIYSLLFNKFILTYK